MDRVTIPLDHCSLMGWLLSVRVSMRELLNNIVIFKKSFSATLSLAYYAVETQ